MRCSLSIAASLIAATLAGAVEPGAPETAPERVETPIRYDNRVRMHEVPLNFKSPDEIRRDEEQARTQPDPRSRKEIFVDEPVQAPPPRPAPQRRPDTEEKRKDDNWLKGMDAGDEGKKRGPSGWGWLVDESRRAAELRDQRNKTPDRPDEDETATGRGTSSVARTDSAWPIGERRDPYARATDAAMPGRDGRTFAGRQPDLPAPGERSQRALQPEDVAMERELARRASWLPPAGFESATPAAQMNPGLLSAPRNAAGSSFDVNAAITALRPAGAPTLEPLAGFTPTRIGTSISAPTDVSPLGSSKPLFDLPGLGGAGIGTAGSALPSLSPSSYTPARDLRAGDQKPPLDGIRANALPW